MKTLYYTILIISFLNISRAWSQTIPALERKVSISFQGKSIEDALNELSQSANFIFSYNPQILKENLMVSGRFTNVSVREVLISILGETIDTKARGNYIILTKAEPPTKKEIARRKVTISGYVTDKNTGIPISEVSVYEKRTLSAVITNEFGFYKISFDEEDYQTVLFFSKRSYGDTLIKVEVNTPHFINVGMTAEPIMLASISGAFPTNPDISVPVEASASKSKPNPILVQSDRFRNFLQQKVFTKDIHSKRESNVNVNNITDTLYRDVQVSFVPFVGTNHKLSGNVVNGYSFNVIGGYSQGTRNLELGGVFNIDRGNVEYGQLAGTFNLVGGTTKGVQAAGVINLTRKKVNALQLAGVANANLDSTRGPQFAGVFNVNARASQGAQFAGVFNLQPADYKGSQFAGVYNVSTQKMKGTQVASVFNYAHNIRGAQIGLINYADSIRGIPLGLMSFVRHGYHKIEVSADEVFYLNLAFRTGVPKFYNIIMVGMKPETWDNTTNATTGNPQTGDWTFGYGIGTAPRLAKWLYLNVDVTANHVNKGDFTNSLSLLNKVYLGFDFQIVKKFSITAGATLNAYLSDPTYSENPVLFTDYSPRIFSDHTFSNGNNMKMWWGAKVGIRFL